MGTKVRSFSWRLETDHTTGVSESFSLLEVIRKADKAVEKLGAAKIVEIDDTLYTLEDDCPVFVRRVICQGD